jgi:xanthine/uracil permease
MDRSVLVGAAVGAIVIALALSFHWALGKLFPRIPWRVSVGAMVAVVAALAYLAIKLEG